MNYKTFIKSTIATTMVFTLGCSGDPSVSIQPVTDTFNNAGAVVTAKMDILFVIDNSVSMRQEQEQMMANFSTFIKEFSGKNYDYRIAVVATDAWVTKGFIDARTNTTLNPDNINYVLTENYFNSVDYQATTVIKTNNDGISVTAYNPADYSGYPDLRFFDANEQFAQMCSRDNYVTSRFSTGDYTKALMGSPLGTHNNESGQNSASADPRYLSDYRILSSDDDSVDSNFYLNNNGIDTRDYAQLVNRDLSFYDLNALYPEIPATAPSGKTHILDIFRNNIMQGLDGCYGESGLESAKVALENSFNQNIDGQDFPRSDAHMAIIVVSDARDELAQVTNSGYGTIPNYALGSDNSGDFSQERLDYYDSFFKSVASSSLGYSLHSIVPTGDEIFTLSTRYSELSPQEPTPSAPSGTDCDGVDAGSSNCYVATDNDNSGQKVTVSDIQPDIACATEWHTDLNGVSVPREAKMYTKLSEKTGGQKASICGDFAEQLEKVAKVIIEKTVVFQLKSIPANINGLNVSLTNPGQEKVNVPLNSENGWTYQAAANAITFHGSYTPEQGSSVGIFYDPNSL